MKEGRAVSVGFSGVEPAPEPEKEPKKARASLPFRLASRAYGSVGTVEQGSYSDTQPEEEVEKSQAINQKVRNKNRKNHSQKNKRTVHSVLCNKQKTEI